MKHILFIGFLVCLTFIACSSQKMAQSSIVTEGISGFVRQQTGNRMPMKGVEPVQPKGIRTVVFVYEPTNTSQVAQIGTSPLYTAIHTKLVASVNTDSTGAFAIKLAPGSYSLFVKHGEQYFSNLFDTNNNISLYTVEPKKVTPVTILVNSSATY